MGDYTRHAVFAPPSPVSPDCPTLDYQPGSQHDGYGKLFNRARSPLSPESMRDGDSGLQTRCDTDESMLFEHAMAELMKDRKTYSAMEPKYQRRNEVPSKKTTPKNFGKICSPSRASRDLRNQATANPKSGKGVRPPHALAATHPALYNQQCTNHQRKMLPTPPPIDYPKGNAPFQYKATPERTSPSPPWKTYTDPNRQLSGEPRFHDPKCRMLKMDLEANQPNVLSPTFMIGLPCGGMIEAAI